MSKEKEKILAGKLLMEIKLIVSDLDGTLLNPESELSQNSIKAVSLVIERGFRFTLCSGRNLGTCPFQQPKCWP